jgi:hypothetical protein
MKTIDALFGIVSGHKNEVCHPTPQPIARLPISQVQETIDMAASFVCLNCTEATCDDCVTARDIGKRASSTLVVINALIQRLHELFCMIINNELERALVAVNTLIVNTPANKIVRSLFDMLAESISNELRARRAMGYLD